MSSRRTYHVFVSYTGQDLAAHAEVVVKVLRTLQHLAMDHRDSGATGQPTVQWCMEQVDKADFLVVLVAHRYGWVPTIEDGGDGRKSITQMEVERAKAAGKTVLPYIIEDSAAWAAHHMEAQTSPQILEDFDRFKSELRRTIASSFTVPSSLDGPLSRDIPKAIERIEEAARTAIAAGTAATSTRQQPLISFGDLKEATLKASASLFLWPTTLGDKQWLERREAEILFDRIYTNENSTTILLGLPGSGKSALLSILGHRLTDNGLPVLAIKADKLPSTIDDIEKLGSYLKLPMTADGCLRRLSHMGGQR